MAFRLHKEYLEGNKDEGEKEEEEEGEMDIAGYGFSTSLRSLQSHISCSLIFFFFHL